MLGDSMPDCGADQCRQLFGMAVAGHRGDERRAAPGRRMKIHLADPFRQVWDQPEDPLLHHGAAPGEAKDVVVGAQIGSPQAAAQRLVGRHDFTTFRNVECQAKSPVKTLDQLDVNRAADDIQVLASARSFLHSQVRSMIGALALVGEGKWTADDVSVALAKRDRAACAPVAPPDGLYLAKVDYA